MNNYEKEAQERREKSETRAQWVQGLKVGDRVEAGFNQNLHVATVERLTSSQVILNDGGRMRKTDGHRIGASRITGYYYRPFTADTHHRIRRQRADQERQQIINEINIGALSMPSLVKVRELVKSLPKR